MVHTARRYYGVRQCGAQSLTAFNNEVSPIPSELPIDVNILFLVN